MMYTVAPTSTLPIKDKPASLSNLMPEPVPIPNARYGPTGFPSTTVPPDSPPLTAPASTDNDYTLLDHLKNDTMVETIATIQSTFLWDGICRGRFLSFPHLALHGDAQTSHIMRVLERWLCDKLMQPQLGDRLPILEESIPDSCRSIMATMHQEKHLLRPFHTCLIQIRSEKKILAMSLLHNNLFAYLHQILYTVSCHAL
ncbi:hypothetical protein K450DRAFT_221544 [Umbelopsis ramanniana AG]|uniref:Uncharacterized protein n=1 Tax=Umbelopsis ramanniana AG TaxID=1314678 RepID=A0AAD5EHN3_UMBRA|nr:uncharacterized protein K450DRAFT_221544 [Umbelopsis ramanniana AG]KAI8583512.1 hypothetical protein K450DRAFT_221544 [Umbelopsis ramanniana AG]